MKSRNLYRLENTIQDYAWGSKISFSRILGFENPDNKPMAELWMGTHPKAPSMTEKGSLDKIISENPETLLGKNGSKFENRLPFLFKVLAAGSPLSIQAHPSREQARKGFSRENSLKIDIGAFNRNYKDDNHKPEILCALTPFTAMWGFRKPGDIKRNFQALECGVVSELLTLLSTENEKEALMGFFMKLMSMPDNEKNELLKAAEKYSENNKDLISRWMERFAGLYPGDPGILAPLYLNILELAPGEAVFIPAGELHAYLDGTGIELMANSDNVLRGGLTPKYVDVPELMSVLTFTSREPELVEFEKKDGITEYTVPAEEFILRKLEPCGNETVFEFDSAQIMICLEGDVLCTVPGGDSKESETLKLGKGESFFAGADSKRLVFNGEGILFAAGIPQQKDV